MGFLGTYLEYTITVITEKKNLFQHPLCSQRRILFHESDACCSGGRYFGTQDTRSKFWDFRLAKDTDE
jgi:hypothetical protein